jgi:hypothetical protein
LFVVVTKGGNEMLTRLDSDTAINLDTVASIKFSGDSAGAPENLEATVKFLISNPSTASFVTEIFSGEAANKLYDLTSDPDDPLPVDKTGAEETMEDPFFPRFTRTKGWYYYEEDDPLEISPKRRYFLAFVNAKGSCSIRTFDTETGRFEGKKYYPGHYQEAFAGTISSATELTVKSQPNLERDCRERLPEAVLAYLKKQVHEKVGKQ